MLTVQISLVSYFTWHDLSIGEIILYQCFYKTRVYVIYIINISISNLFSNAMAKRAWKDSYRKSSFPKRTMQEQGTLYSAKQFQTQQRNFLFVCLFVCLVWKQVQLLGPQWEDLLPVYSNSWICTQDSVITVTFPLVFKIACEKFYAVNAPSCP